MQKLTKFKVIFDLFTVCVYFIQQQNCKLYYIYLMIISEIQSEIGHCSCDSAKFKAPADFSHHAILCMTLSLMLKGLKSVNLKIIQMYHFRLKWKRYTVCTNWWDSNFLGLGLPLFPVGLLLFARWES